MFLTLRLVCQIWYSFILKYDLINFILMIKLYDINGSNNYNQMKIGKNLQITHTCMCSLCYKYLTFETVLSLMSKFHYSYVWLNPFHTTSIFLNLLFKFLPEYGDRYILSPCWLAASAPKKHIPLSWVIIIHFIHWWWLAPHPIWNHQRTKIIFL